MSHSNGTSGSCCLWLALAASLMLACTSQAHAAFHYTGNGDFNGQALGSLPTAPWIAGNETVGPIPPKPLVTAGVQSPFTDVFAANNRKVNVAATNNPVSNTNNPFLVNYSTAIFPASATGKLQLNADFRVNSTDTGYFSLVVSDNGNAALATAALYINGTTVVADTSGGLQTITSSLQQNVWYNAKLALDLNTDTYSVTLTPDGGSAATTSGLSFKTNNQISAIYSDGRSSRANHASLGAGNNFIDPDHDLDNFVLSNVAVGSGNTIVNIDFEGTNGDGPTPTGLAAAGLFGGQGAAGGGTYFNPILVNSTGSNFNLPATGTNFLDSNGNPTTIDFTISNIGGDTAPSQERNPDVLYDDYIFANASKPFTISGLGSATTADLYFYTSFTSLNTSITVGGQTQFSTGIGNSTITYANGLTALFFDNVPVVSGNITGTFNSLGGTSVLGGLTIVTVPEPTAFGILFVGGLAFLACRRRS